MVAARGSSCRGLFREDCRMSLLARLTALGFAALLPALPSSTAQAQDYPSRPVKIIVPFGAGGPADVFSRQIAQHLSDALKQSFVVEDRSEEHTSELQSQSNLVCRLLLEKKKKKKNTILNI